MPKQELSLQDRLDNWLAQEQEQRSKRKRSGKFNPSSFGKCYRAQIWNRANEPQTNPPDKRALKVFKAGQLFHDFVQQFIPQNQKEVQVEEDDVKGYADIVGQEKTYDIKSQHSRAFWYQEKKGYDIKKDKYNNWLQVAYYSIKLNKPKMSLVFISKDDLCIAEYVEWTENWVKEVNQELAALRKHWQRYLKTKQLPPAQPRCYNGKEGKYCPFLDKCKELGWDCEKQKEIIKKITKKGK